MLAAKRLSWRVAQKSLWIIFAEYICTDICTGEKENLHDSCFLSLASFIISLQWPAKMMSNLLQGSIKSTVKFRGRSVWKFLNHFVTACRLRALYQYFFKSRLFIQARTLLQTAMNYHYILNNTLHSQYSAVSSHFSSPNTECKQLRDTW